MCNAGIIPCIKLPEFLFFSFDNLNKQKKSKIFYLNDIKLQDWMIIDMEDYFDDR